MMIPNKMLKDCCDKMMPDKLYQSKHCNLYH